MIINNDRIEKAHEKHFFAIRTIYYNIEIDGIIIYETAAKDENDDICSENAI